jgi:phage I-like protein
MRLNGTSLFSAIECDESTGVPVEIQILKTGKFNHPSYGYFQITPLILQEMKKNFDSRVRGIDLAVDYFHESDKEASGWITGLNLKEGGQELWASIRWTPTAEKKLSQRELRYFSPDFTFKWTDPESGKTFSNVLFGGGLTNRPFLKDMQAIVANENKGEKMTEEQIKELEAKNLKLSEEMKKLEDAMPAKDAALADLQKQIDELKAQLQAALGQVEVEMKEKAKLQEDIQMKEKENSFTKLLSEGKAVVAQRDAFLKGDMDEFIKLAQPVNFKPAGSGAGNDESDSDSKVMKLAEELVKSEKIDLGTAISKALKQIKGGN